MRKKYFAIYDDKERLIFVGNIKECAKYLETTEGCFMSSISRLRKGRYKTLRNGYMAYELDDTEEE